MTVQIDIRGIAEVQRNLAKLQGAELQKRMNRAAFGIGKELEGIMKVYPPPPPSSTYRRTGTLKRRWGTKAKRWGAVVGNPTKYANWVQKEGDQTAGHKRTGWTTDVKGAEELSSRDTAIKRIVLSAVLRGVA